MTQPTHGFQPSYGKSTPAALAPQLAAPPVRPTLQAPNIRAAELRRRKVSGQVVSLEHPVFRESRSVSAP
jgi:hypothetical protein